MLVTNGPETISELRLFFAQLRTLVGGAARSVRCRVEMWRGGVRQNISVAAPFVWRCPMLPPWLRFHIPLIEPDRQISRIRLSDKTSRLSFRVQRLLQFLNTQIGRASCR